MLNVEGERNVKGGGEGRGLSFVERGWGRRWTTPSNLLFSPTSNEISLVELKVFKVHRRLESKLRSILKALETEREEERKATRPSFATVKRSVSISLHR